MNDLLYGQVMDYCVQELVLHCQTEAFRMTLYLS